MRFVRLLTDHDKASFDRISTHPVQSWEWGDFRKEYGNRVVRVGVFVQGGKSDLERLVEGHQITIHRLPHTSYSVAMLLKGPVPSRQAVEFLKDFGKKEKIVFFRTEPNLINSGKISRFLVNNGFVTGRRFFTKSTFWVDLGKSEEELLGGFHPKTRYNIRVAERHGVRVVEEDTRKAFEKYLTLTEQTAGRQNFFAHTERYHKLMWKHLCPSGIAHLLSAKYQGKTLISWIMFVWHDTLYYPYGASSDKHRNVMAANLMMWEAIKFGKSLGLRKFDLWGREEGRGFTKFKEGYNPEVVEFVGTWDLVISKKLYPVYRAVEDIRWKLLKLPLPFPKPSFR